MTTKRVAQEMRALKEQGLTNQAIADEYHTSEASVRRALHSIGYKPYLIPGYARRKLDVKLEKPMVIDVAKSGAGAITADWHHPLADYGLINTFLDHAVEIGATNWLAVAGDWFNIDALSAFDYKQESANLTQELYGSTETMRRVLEVFDRVYLSWGNHDARVHKTLGYKVPFATAMRMMFHDLDAELMDRVELSNLDNITILGPQGEYQLVHPAAYNSVPLSTARKLASKMLKHTVTGHSHHTAIGHDPSGSFVCAELGGFFDAAKTAYLQRTTTFPVWQNGYGFIDKDGYIVIEGQGWSSRIGSRV